MNLSRYIFSINEYKTGGVENFLLSFDYYIMFCLQIKYGNKEINLGTEITPSEAKLVPEVHYKHEGGILYTLVMTGMRDFFLLFEMKNLTNFIEYSNIS